MQALVNEGPAYSLRSTTVCPRLLQVAVHEIQHVLPVETEHSARSAAGSVEAEGRDACDDVALAQEIRTTGITEAGTSGGVIVREEKREVARKARVDLDQMRLGEHSYPRGLNEHRV